MVVEVETDKKQESEKDAGISRNAMQRHGAWRARVGVTGRAASRSAAPAGTPRYRWSVTPDEMQKSGRGLPQWKGIQARGDGEWTGLRVDLAWRWRMTAMPG